MRHLRQRRRPTAGDAPSTATRRSLRLPGAAEERYDLARTRLAGRHNVENILAAVTVARLAARRRPRSRRRSTRSSRCRTASRWWRERDGVRWYDDSKATNVGAAVKSLESFAEPVVLLAGGVDKGGDYAPLAAAARGRVRRALVFGAARERLAAALEAAEVAVERVADLAAAVGAAAAAARAGRRRAARAGVLELRHVHGLCGARASVPRRGGGVAMTGAEALRCRARAAADCSAGRSPTSGRASCAPSAAIRGSCWRSPRWSSLGIVMVFNVSYFPGGDDFGDPLHFFRKHLVSIALGIVLCVDRPSRIGSNRYRALAYPLLVGRDRRAGRWC